MGLDATQEIVTHIHKCHSLMLTANSTFMIHNAAGVSVSVCQVCCF